MNYVEAVNHVLLYGAEDLNARTGQKTKRVFGCSIEYIDGRVFTPRECNPGIAAAELAWMLSGERNTKWLKKHCKIWEKFEDQKDFIHTAYGHRWRHAFNRDQINEAIQLLKKDPSSRQALVMAWDPSEDGLANQGKVKNVPCPFAFSLYVSAGSLKIVVYQRSADLVAGVPYDLMTYWLLGKGVSKVLGYEFSGVTIVFGDLHIYQDHYETAKKIVWRTEPFGQSRGLRWMEIGQILMDPDDFVKLNWKIWDGSFSFKENVKVAQ